MKFEVSIKRNKEVYYCLKLLFKMLLTFDSLGLLFIIFLINKKIYIPFLGDENISYLIYILALIGFTGMCLLISRKLSKDTIQGGIVEIESANNSYLPTYLGYFFVALGITDYNTLFWVFIIIFIFTFNSQNLFFNPMFLMYGYKFYYVKTKNGKKIFVISKKEIRTTKDADFTELLRINDYTFIDGRKKK